MAKVTLKNIKKVYEGGVVAVHSFNLEIKDKEFVVLVGPSGCGKSTTLRMIAGLENITEGELYIDDKLVNDIAPKDRDIAMVFQNYALYPHMTVYQNIAFPLQMHHMDKKTIDKKVREAAEILDITELLSRKPKALSGGQRQRVAIGRAIVRDPHVFLMDEPLSNLDAKLRNQMRAEIIKLRQKIDTTFIYVTHDQTEAMTLGDRIVIMKDGLIMQIGTPTEVFEHPDNIFVAGFIGTPQMNFFDGQLEKKNGIYQAYIGDNAISLPAAVQKELTDRSQPDAAITVGIRPEHITLLFEDNPQAFKGQVDVSEMMGSEIHLHAVAMDKEIIIRVPITELPAQYHSGFKAGEPIRFSFDPELIHLFDKETGQRI